MSSDKDDDFAFVDVPDHFCCPLTLDIMTDPVVDHEGNTFERAAIEAWIREHETSPITRSPLQVGNLTPNRVLRNIIEQYTSDQLAQQRNQQVVEEDWLALGIGPTTFPFKINCQNVFGVQQKMNTTSAP